MILNLSFVEPLDWKLIFANEPEPTTKIGYTSILVPLPSNDEPYTAEPTAIPLP